MAHAEHVTAGDAERGIQARHVVPILNVSNLSDSFAWFAKLGWAKDWEWCPPGGSTPSFGAVVSGELEVFVCLDGQGGRGKVGGVGGDGQGVARDLGRRRRRGPRQVPS